LSLFREFFGYLLGMAFCVLAVAACGLAWLGLEAEFGWQWALGAVVVGVIFRINIALPVGMFFYASHAWAWPLPQALAFSAPGLLLVLPTLAISLFAMLIGRPAARY
jgi:thiamine transporter ThiT